MKPVFEKTPQRDWESFHCEVVRGESYNAVWHFHPELQLTLALQSCGYRLVGDRLDSLAPGDLVLVGANLPHVWQQDRPNGAAGPGVHAIILRFRETFAGRELLELPEAGPLRRLFRRAARGLEVSGRTRREAAVRMERIPQLSGLTRLGELLVILDLLAHSTELKPLATSGYVAAPGIEDEERMRRVLNYIDAHLGEAIGRAEAAAAANLSVGAFSRFFNLRTGKSLPQYVNEMRVGRACRRLADERLKVLDIAMETGFSSLANFNRRFREITRVSPRDYRVQLRKSTAPARAL